MIQKARLLLVLSIALFAQAAFGQELIEKVVVRNRLYSMAGKVEVGADVGFTLLSRLTDHINLNAHGAYNLSDTLAFELRAGYALSRHTGLASQIAEDFAANPSIRIANDLSELWEMNGNGAVGVRWAPIYGKISLMAEMPVHFQAYLWLGAGAATLKRTSLVYCVSGGTRTCDAYLEENKISPVLSVAAGGRFFLTPSDSLKLEIRDWSYPDSYLDNIVREDAKSGRATGEANRNPGITNLVQIDVGYSFSF